MWLATVCVLHKINILTSVILIACTAACTTNVQLCVQRCGCCVWVSLLLFHAAAVIVVVAVCICIGIPLVWFAFACKNFRNSAEDARACGRITLGVAVEFPWKRGSRGKPGVACQLMLHIHALISAGFHHLI